MVSIRSTSSSDKSYAKMGGEKDIPLFDGNSDKYEHWLIQWNSKAIWTKFIKINNSIRQYPEVSIKGRNKPKHSGKAVNKRVTVIEAE